MEPPNVPRRLAAILAADVAGYSRLTGLDEEGTLARLRGLRYELINPCISTHRGRVVKTTGDGLLVEFASAVDAVRCALDVQRGMIGRNATLPTEKRIEFRVGINVGDVVVEGDDLLGDGVNIAARLEGISDPGGICVSDNAYRHVLGKVDAEFVDLGEQALKNIARPVLVYRIDLSKEGGPRRPAVAAEEPDRPVLSLPNKPSVAVLPFTNMSGDPDQDYFADGMVEDITTALSRIRWLFVIARNSSFVFKGRTVDVKQVGRELGVRYVLEGSVRKSGNRVRITGQLIEAQSGTHLWAERYDRPLDDIFTLQDEITLSVVGAIEPSLRQAEIERVKRKRPGSFDAYDLFLQALAASYSRTPEDHTRALALVERVLVLEPGYVGAHALMADAHRGRYIRGEGREEDREEALRHARAELAAGCDDATALAMVGFVVYLLGQDVARAREIFERALQISPSSNLALQWSASMLAMTGEHELAIERAERALRLSPFDPLKVTAHIPLAQAYFLTGRYREAAEAARHAVEANPQFGLSYLLEAASLVRLGRIDDARAAAAHAPRASGLRPSVMGSNQTFFQPILDALAEAGVTP